MVDVFAHCVKKLFRITNTLSWHLKTVHIVCNNLPISVVDLVEFKKLFQESIPTYAVPCRQTFSNVLIPEKVLILN